MRLDSHWEVSDEWEVDVIKGRKLNEVKKRRSEGHITYIADSLGVTKSELQIAFELDL